MGCDKIVVGYTTTNFLLLDFDETTFNKVIGISKIISKNFNLGNFIILKSSNGKTKYILQDKFMMEKTIDGSYHVVFGKRITYNKICNIITLLADLDVMQKEYANIRHWRGDITLRISSDNSDGAYRPQPRLLYINEAYSMNENNEGIFEYTKMLESVY